MLGVLLVLRTLLSTSSTARTLFLLYCRKILKSAHEIAFIYLLKLQNQVKNVRLLIIEGEKVSLRVGLVKGKFLFKQFLHNNNSSSSLFSVLRISNFTMNFPHLMQLNFISSHSSLDNKHCHPFSTDIPHLSLSQISNISFYLLPAEDSEDVLSCLRSSRRYGRMPDSTPQ